MNSMIRMTIIVAALFVGLVPAGSASEGNGVPERLVSMSPNLTQIVFALGAESLLVGVDDYSVYSADAESIPRMGSYLDPDLEALIFARPDLVLVVETDEQITQMLSDLGIEYESFGNDTVEDILASIERLGILLDRGEAAGELLDRFRRTRRDVERALEGAEPTRIALVVGRNPGRLQDIYVASSSCFLGELIEMAGGENVFGELGLAWPQVGVEVFVGTDPDVIIDSTLSKGATDAEFEALEADWDALPSLRAVRNDRIIVPREGWFQIPGAHLDSTLRLMAHWLHPDIFPEETGAPTFQPALGPRLSPFCRSMCRAQDALGPLARSLEAIGTCRAHIKCRASLALGLVYRSLPAIRLPGPAFSHGPTGNQPGS